MLVFRYNASATVFLKIIIYNIQYYNMYYVYTQYYNIYYIFFKIILYII